MTEPRIIKGKVERRFESGRHVVYREIIKLMPVDEAIPGSEGFYEVITPMPAEEIIGEYNSEEDAERIRRHVSEGGTFVTIKTNEWTSDDFRIEPGPINETLWEQRVNRRKERQSVILSFFDKLENGLRRLGI